METIKYEIGDKNFYQRPLSNYQETLVEELLFSLKRDASIKIEDSGSLFQAIGPKRSEFMAYFMIPMDMTIKDFVKSLQSPGFIDQQIDFFEYSEHVTPGIRYEVIADFFDCNQAGLCIRAMESLMNQLQKAEDQILRSQLESALSGSAPLSQEGTQQTEIPSTA